MIFGKPGFDEISTFYRHMAVMLRSGVPLPEAISALSEEKDLPEIKGRAAVIRKDLAAGIPLGECLEKHPDIFNPVLIRILTGDFVNEIVADLLDKFADTEERTGKGDKRVYSIMIYPLFVLGAAMIITFFLLVFVIPVFQEMFADFGASLPGVTQAVVSISLFIKNYLYLFVTGVIGLILFFVFNRKYYFLVLSKLPRLGDLQKKIAISTFAEYMSLMLSVRAPLKEAVDHSARSVRNLFYADILNGLTSKSEDVTGLNQAMKDSGLFPKMLIKTMEINQTTNALESAMAETSRYYGKNIGRLIEKQMTVLEILVMLFLGIVVGVLVIAMYMPIFRMAGSI